MFKEKKTTVENMTYVAIMSAIVVVISLLTSFIPMAGAVFGLVVPIIGTLVALFAKPRFSIVFIVVTVLLSVVASLYAIQNTMFFIIPPVITGLIFGLLLRKGIGPSVSLIACAITQAIINVGVYFAIDILYELNVIQMLLDLLNLATHRYIDTIIGLGVLMFALIQFILSYILVYPYAERFTNNKTNNKKELLVHLLICSLSPILMVISVYFAPFLSYVFFGVSIYSACFLLYSIITEKKILKIIYVIFLSFGASIAFIATSSIPDMVPYTLLFFGLIPFFLVVPFISQIRYLIK